MLKQWVYLILLSVLVNGASPFFYKINLKIFKNNNIIFNSPIEVINDKFYGKTKIISYNDKSFLFIKCKKRENSIKKEIGGILLHDNNSFDINCYLNKESKLICDFNFYNVTSVNKMVEDAIHNNKCVNFIPKENKKSFNVVMNITKEPKKVNLGDDYYLIYNCKLLKE